MLDKLSFVIYTQSRQGSKATDEKKKKESIEITAKMKKQKKAVTPVKKQEPVYKSFLYLIEYSISIFF